MSDPGSPSKPHKKPKSERKKSKSARKKAATSSRERKSLTGRPSASPDPPGGPYGQRPVRRRRRLAGIVRSLCIELRRIADAMESVDFGDDPDSSP
ncbi:hypothetical protein PHYBLDRAFT_138908 [Phycomyces blakesleeanus NRRL 1555(-)]|uniref:Uncharacterized protein n=1 Tax=Phycomyces blakesleeanus (strain ATCC 8743b / DSM 1359 / FGSC 10004 / NBRC 33097 / NRRL 1555) TaxID=763407 RepID=A0A162VAX0_PHYB8|nr:hypothetical protein PHYBLDRAFT_138908 [Phycomyces blakesleeanus NRRL 1555(-)]OAD81363.1 hypothetical protein PHYBLDRAFT_138908 [Phycomyces blakesleeanus NRRL 1555(-)]|eukprot:XP_018299403.1 hypothetical protein PHYBLDRAFT_138908 [Phycomyces blakesleeanus NRRL 1555(-)]